MSKKTHWRDALHKEYLHGSEITKPFNVTVKEFSTIEVYSPKSREKEEMVVLHFQEDIKALILTGRKASSLEKIAGSPFIEDWVGTTVSLSALDEKHFGQIMPVIQVEPPIKVKKKPALTPESPKWKDAVTGIKGGTVTLDQIKGFYTLSKENESELIKQTK